MANRLNWSPGHQGKGNWYKNGDISTWNVDEELNPHHSEVAQREMNDPNDPAGIPGFYFFISPTGGVHDGDIGFNNQSPYSDDHLVQEIVAQDPALYDGREEEDFSHGLEPRVEMPEGGYGHAYNLLKLMSKLGVNQDGWADFHTELKLPRSIRQKIRRWVDRLDWPEGSEKADARTYHITILSMDEYDENFAKWARQQMSGRVFTFKSVKMDIFKDEHVVLRLDCPEWTELVLEWQRIADDQGLKPRKFNPPKAHVTIGRSPSGKWPQGIPDPHLKFDTRQFNINKNSHHPCNQNKISQETTVADELKSWLDSFTPEQQALQPSLHHTDADQFQPEIVAPQSLGPHIDPPSKPYQPYDWAEQGWEESPLNRVATDLETHVCPRCGEQIDASICPFCEYDPTHAGTDYEQAKANWYDRAWDEPGNQPRPVPNQPMHWRHDNATDVKYAAANDQQDIWHTADNELEDGPQADLRRATRVDQRGRELVSTSHTDYSKDDHELDNQGWISVAGSPGGDPKPTDDLYPLWARKQYARDTHHKTVVRALRQLPRGLQDPSAVSWREI